MEIGSPNQDACIVSHSQRPTGGIVIAVADGHGSPEYVRAQIGSCLACTLAADWSLKFLSKIASRPRKRVPVVEVQVLCQQIHQAWLGAVRNHYKRFPFLEEEWALIPASQVKRFQAKPETAYGSTLLVALAWSTGLIALQLGDGDILHANEAKMRLLFDEKHDGESVTDSLCDAAAADKFQIMVDSFDLGVPSCVALRTDGWANSFENSAEQHSADQALVEQLLSSELPVFETELPPFLSEMSARGWSHGDDVSMAVLVKQEKVLRHAVAEKRNAKRQGEGTTGIEELADLLKVRSK